jgi:cytochrome c
MPFRRALFAALLLSALAGCGAPKGGGGGGGTGDGALPPSPKVKAALAALPPPYSGADIKNGEAQFSLCRSCHTIIKGGANMTGPNLYGVYGRAAGGAADFSYSEALKGKALHWDAATLDQWLQAPGTFVPGTKMSFVGLKDDKDRRDVIGYIALASTGALD